MPMNNTYESNDLIIVQDNKNQMYYVFNTNEGEIESKGFNTLEKAENERESMLN
jgi:hypothetical protein